MTRRILAEPNRLVLEQFAWSKVLVALDFDGTLAPIVDDPARAGMRPLTRRRLAEVSTRYPVAVISGRAQADVRARLDGISVTEVVGNHGVEPWRGDPRLEAQVASWAPVLAARLRDDRGIHVEDKRYSLAIHYRQSREKRRARAAIAAAIADLGGARVIGGKLVVNLLPAGAPNKGTALERARERARCDTAIYVGDDETDEDVFRLDQPGRLLTIRVGPRRTSLAHYCVRDQREVDALLDALLELRAGRRRQTA